MIIMDYETTGIPEPALVPLEQQPKIIEVGLMKVRDDDLGVVETFHTLVNPGMPLPPLITKITGITTEMVAKAKKFPAHVNAITDFFLGERYVVAHNEPFDHRMLELELQRLDRVTAFPWPPVRICTVERTSHRTGKFLKLTELYQLLFGRDPEQKHRALGDVEILHEVCIKLRAEDVL